MYELTIFIKFPILKVVHVIILSLIHTVILNDSVTPYSIRLIEYNLGQLVVITMISQLTTLLLSDH